MLNFLLEQFFPTTCGMCGKIYKESVCNKCKIKIDKKIICKLQIKYINHEFVKSMYLLKYEEELRNIMLSYKFKEKVYLCDFFVKIILKRKKVYKFFESYDIIIAVPIHNKKMKIRGYNQSSLIAEKLAKNVKNLQYRNDILIKIKNNSRQSSLNLEERKINVKNVYDILNLDKVKLEVQNKRILIFDDIYTTGSTINECIRNIKKLNPSKIGIFTIFRD